MGKKIYPKILKCGFCNKELDKKDLAKNIVYSAGNYYFPCPYCNAILGINRR